MTLSIEAKRLEIACYIETHPEDGHPHYWCGGIETDCNECNMDHPMTELHLAMWREERELFVDHPSNS